MQCCYSEVVLSLIDQVFVYIRLPAWKSFIGCLQILNQIFLACCSDFVHNISIQTTYRI